MIHPLLIGGLIAASCVCAEPVVVNKTKEWNRRDRKVVEQAKKRCGEIYQNSPCLVRFTKTEEHAYQVICGACK